MKEIRLGIIGVGNCASNLTQGIFYYQNNSPEGIMHEDIGGYRINQIKPVVAFDVSSEKVGKDLSEAIFSPPNNTVKISDVPFMDVEVMKGPVLDGIGEYMSNVVNLSDKETVNVAQELKKNNVDVLINLLPVGSAQATRFYAEEAIKAGCGFVNAIPEFIASNEAWAAKFFSAGVPIIGDDTKSQVGATIVHRAITDLCKKRGAIIDKTYQLNVGGNTDFYNMLERSRLASKKISKTESVQSQMKNRLADDKIHIGPSDYVPWLDSRKLAFIRIEGRLFGNVPFDMEIRLNVEDKANSSGTIVDAIRCCALAKDRKISGVLIAPSAYYCKHPPQQFSDDEALRMLEEFISKKEKMKVNPVISTRDN